ncbi:MAG TPA: hypothetical protein VFB96_24765 [Pirellulaceae bacterium]|nr:hypothetical protein [Pirellulaceae bacterium]
MTDSTASVARASWPRWAARASLLAAFVCFAVNCVFMQLTRQQAPSETALINQIVGWGTMTVVAAGILAGAAALAGAWRQRARETLVMAAMGLTFNVGIVLVTLWLLSLIRQARA